MWDKALTHCSGLRDIIGDFARDFCQSLEFFSFLLEGWGVYVWVPMCSKL